MKSLLLRTSCAIAIGLLLRPAPVLAEEGAPTESGLGEPSRFTLGLRGFGGGVFTEGEQRGGGGASALAAYALVPERWELELGLSVVAGRRIDALGVFEVVGKRLFERRGPWAPHMLLGPAFSLDFGSDVHGSAGAVLGFGATHWLGARLGIVGDAVYRLLIGSEVENVLTLAFGVSLRL